MNERQETQKLLGVTTLDCLLELLDEVIEGRTDEELKRLAGDLKGDLESLPFADRGIAASERKDMNEMAKEALEDLSSLSDEELQRRFESHGNDEKRKAQIEAEANKRMPNNFLYAGAFSDGAEWADANPIKPQGDEKPEESVACPACTEEFYLSDFRRAPKPASCHDHDSSSMTEETVSVPREKLERWVEAVHESLVDARPCSGSLWDEMEAAIRKRGEGNP